MEKPQFVYVVLHGEQCEGGHVVRVFKDYDDAKKAALGVNCCFSGGWTPDGEDYWENGCDFVTIEKWGVD